MIETSGDLWEHRCPVKVITTNGDINRRGEAVMGRGVALQAKGRFTGIERMLAEHLRNKGNHVGVIATFIGLTGRRWPVIAFPVKHHWHERASLPLIEQSAHEIVALADIYGFRRLVMPRPGCGNGGLHWPIVKLLIAPILDDRFIVIERD